MDEYAHQLELLLNQDSSIEDSKSMEKTPTDTQIQSTSSKVTLMKPSMLTPSVKPSNAIHVVNLASVPQNPIDFIATKSQHSFMPTSSLSNYMTTAITTTPPVIIGSKDSYEMIDKSSPKFLNSSFPIIAEEKFYKLAGGYSSQQQLAKKNIYYLLEGYPSQQQLSMQNDFYHARGGCPPYEQPLEENLYHVMRGCSSQCLQQRQLPLRGYISLRNQVPNVDQQTLLALTGSNPTYLNPSGNPMDPNWEAINSFLLGQVRPSPDISRVYKCNICSIEFPNAQAFGGHMSSHSKHKKREMMRAPRGHLKKVNLKPSSSKKIGMTTLWSLSKKSIRLKNKNENNKKENKVDYESD